MVMMVRQLGMGHGMVMMMVVVVMMMRSRVVCGWCDLLAGCLRFVFPRSQRLMNGRSISRRMRGMMVVMMMVMVMVMVRERRRCLLVVMLRLGYTTWLTWHLIGRSGNRHSVRIIMIWYTVYFVWHGRMKFLAHAAAHQRSSSSGAWGSPRLIAAHVQRATHRHAARPLVAPV